MSSHFRKAHLQFSFDLGIEILTSVGHDSELARKGQRSLCKGRPDALHGFCLYTI